MNYRKTYEQVHGKIPKTYEIHHIDWNRKNNHIDNLIAIPKSLHVAIHKIGFCDRETIKKALDEMEQPGQHTPK